MVNAALVSSGGLGTSREAGEPIARERRFLDSRDAVREALRNASRREQAEIVHVVAESFFDRGIKELSQLFVLLDLEDSNIAFLVPPSFGDYLAPWYPRCYKRLLKNEVEDGLVQLILQPANMRASIGTKKTRYVVDRRMELDISP